MKQLNIAEMNALLAAAPAGATVYLIGVAGCGMSVLGHLLLDQGFQIHGADLKDNKEAQELAARGARIYRGHTEEQLTEAQPWLVVYSSAIRADNPELVAAVRAGVPYARRATMLAALAGRHRAVCVAGMHGKTTTAALLAFALERLGQAPGYAIGAPVAQLQPPARLPQNNQNPNALFVVEADESDGTLTEFKPHYAIVLNVDEEHLDHYQNFAAITKEFQQFGSQTIGPLVYCADDARLEQLYGKAPAHVSYGFNPAADYRIAWPLEGEPGNVFDLWKSGTRLGPFRLSLLGEKNISNASAVIALLHQLNFPMPAVAEAIGSFTGAARRQEQLFRNAQFRIVDDYGHHPSEIAPTLHALKSSGVRRLLVAFQPHRYTRTKELLSRFAQCFEAADRLWITDVYAAGEPPITGIDGARLAAEVRSHGQVAEFVPDVHRLPRIIREAMTPGDLVLFSGAGSITEAAHALAELIRHERIESGTPRAVALSARLSPESIVRENEPLAKRTTLRVGGKADLYVEPASENDLSRVLAFCGEQKLPFIVLGRGSNLLIKDGGVRGVVICLANAFFSRVNVADDLMHCGAGARLKTVAVEARRHALADLEFLEGIPGSVGGALRMNAGAMGSWIFDVVQTIRFMDFSGNIAEREASEVNVEYRGCPLFKTHIALGATLRGTLTTPQVVAERMNNFSRKRWDSQPSQPSAGCMFKNPRTIPAGKLIDELGLKGTRVGGAVVSDVHGNFIVNEGRATANDVLALIEIIKQRARQERGIELETEVEIIGE